MTKDAGKTLERLLPVETLGQEEEAESVGVTLPDESDRIIHDLKSRLSHLQGQLAVFQQKERLTSPDPETARQERDNLQWNQNLAGKISHRMQMPAQELTARLERLIRQVADPDIRAELERCRETAFHLFDTFRQLTRNHRLLSDSLTLRKEEIGGEELGRRLAEELGKAGMTVPVEGGAQLPANMWMVPMAALAAARILALVAADLKGSGIGIGLSLADPPSEDSESGLRWLDITIRCQWNWSESKGGQDVGSVVFKPGVNAGSVVDWLYLEKIVELQGGAVSFHREAGRAAGFSVRLPFEKTPGAK
ncbi:MAG: hypothetical protein OEV94_08070 [Deltaproteobacteria bacterium]|nr:hypothetical protein [Deltaproteobacteria bacterium]